MKVEIKELVHEYPSGHRALNGADLVIDGLDPVAIIGQNGAGKTTLVKHFNGILRPTSGEVYINGREVSSKRTAEWASTVGYVFQNPDNQLFLESVKNELEFGPRQIGVSNQEIASRIEWVSELLGLSEFMDSNPADLSPAQKKFCAMGTVIMMKPDIIIFDEPTCGQDIYGLERLAEVIQVLRSSGQLCITISHDTKFVAKCFPKTVVMCRGKVLLQGDTREVFSQPDVLRQSFVIPPPIARVSQASGLKPDVFDVSTLINEIKKSKMTGGSK